MAGVNDRRPHRRKAADEEATDGTGHGAPGSPEAPGAADTGLTLDDLKADLVNRRLHTPRGAKMLQESIEQIGAARSIVIDEDNVILAGNGVVEAAGEAGLSKVLVVETDGRTVVAVRRSGLSAEEKRALALYDNRTGELSKWDADQLMDDRLHKLPLRPFFDEAELKKHMREQSAKEAVVKELDTTGVNDKFWIAIRGPLQSQAIALDRLKQMMADVEGVEVELGLVQDQPVAKEDDW